MVKLSKQLPEFSLIRMVRFDTDLGEAIENPELLLAQSLVYDERIPVARKARGRRDDLGGDARANIWRSDDDIGCAIGRERCEPSSECFGLLSAEVGQWYVHIAHVDIDHSMTGRGCRFARDIARRFTMPYDVQPVRPDLVVGHDAFAVKSRAGLSSAEHQLPLTGS